MASGPEEKLKAKSLSLEDIPEDAPPIPNHQKTIALPAESAVHKIKAKKVLERDMLKDPRYKMLQKLDPEQKLKRMSAKYDFDRRIVRWWVFLPGLFLIYAKYMHIILPWFGVLVPSLKDMASDSLSAAITSYAQSYSFIQYAELILIFTPVVVNPFRNSGWHFVVDFDGLDVPHLLNPPPGESIHRNRLPWVIIESVELKEHKLGPALQLLGTKGRVLGEIRWDLKMNDKKVLRKIIEQYTVEAHPLRQWLRREVPQED